MPTKAIYMINHRTFSDNFRKEKTILIKGFFCLSF